MSSNATRWALEQSLDALQAIVLVALADLADRNGLCICSPQELALTIDASIPAALVEKNLLLLSEAGLITIDATPSVSPGKHRYQLIFTAERKGGVTRTKAGPNATKSS